MSRDQGLAAAAAAAPLALLAVTTALMGALSVEALERGRREQVELRAASLALQLAAAGAGPAARGDRAAARERVSTLLGAPGLSYALLHDRDAGVLACVGCGDEPLAPPPLLPRPGAGDRVVRELDRETGAVVEAAAPIRRRVGRRLVLAGAARVAIAAGGGGEARTILSTAGLCLAAGLALALAFGRLLGRRLGALASEAGAMRVELREKLYMERFMSSAAMSAIRGLRGSEPVRLSGERRHVAVLFSDVRGFTALSESLDPEEVVDLLNIYLDLQARVIEARGGAIDKFVGDEVMAVFTGAEAESRAAVAAHEIQAVIGSLNEARATAGRRCMEVGIGLNCGQVVMGSVGAESRMDYTVIGSVINTAARLCARASPGQTVMSREFLSLAADRVVSRPLEALPMKGRAQPLPAAELTAVAQGSRLHLRRALQLFGSCARPGLPGAEPVRLRDLGPGGCLLECRAPLAPGTRVELSACLPALGDRLVGGVVRHAGVRGERAVAGIAFEGLSEEDRRQLVEWAHGFPQEARAA